MAWSHGDFHITFLVNNTVYQVVFQLSVMKMAKDLLPHKDINPRKQIRKKKWKSAYSSSCRQTWRVPVQTPISHIMTRVQWHISLVSWNECSKWWSTGIMPDRTARVFTRNTLKIKLQPSTLHCDRNDNLMACSHGFSAKSSYWSELLERVAPATRLVQTSTWIGTDF
jgi:hypothetical protein